MNHHRTLKRGSLPAAILASWMLGAAGAGYAQTGIIEPQIGIHETVVGSMILPLPSKSDSADVAFRRLDAANVGYVTKEQVKDLAGFDAAFDANDVNHDGQLSAEEFRGAWMNYSGNVQ